MQRRKYALLKQPFELDALGDVTLTNPVLGDVMYYDGSFWINTPYAELVDDRVAALLVAGNNIDITYNDGANTLTIDVEGLASADISDFTEAAQDAVGAMVSTSGSGVDLVYTDSTPSLAANLDINGLTAEASVDPAADYFVMYDASAGAHRKVLGEDMPGGGGGAVDAWEVGYDNGASGLAATNVQDALDELESLIGSGGGGGWYIEDDFFICPPQVVAGPWPWDAYATGTGAAVAAVQGESNAPGILRFTTGTATNGQATATYGSNDATVAHRPLIVGGGEIVFEARVRASAAGDATNQYFARFGFVDELSGAPGDGIYFGTVGSSGVWQYTCRTTAASATFTNDPDSLTIGTSWTHLKLVINAAGTSVEFFVDGVSKATVTTNIPATGLTLGVGVQKSSGATSRDIDVDYVRAYQKFTTARW